MLSSSASWVRVWDCWRSPALATMSAPESIACSVAVRRAGESSVSAWGTTMTCAPWSAAQPMPAAVRSAVGAVPALDPAPAVGPAPAPVV